MIFPELGPKSDWTETVTAFSWCPSPSFNAAEEMCGRWARREPDRAALFTIDEAGARQSWSYGALWRASARLANLLTARGIGPGDRIAILLPQSAETVIAWLAAARMGAIIVPLFTLFGQDALGYRLGDSGAAVLLTDAANMPKVAAVRPETLRIVLSVDGPLDGAEGFETALSAARDVFEGPGTGPDTPFLLSYTSGTTGPPKGALHGHKVLAAHVVGARMLYDFLPHSGDVMWTPADWAWMGGSMNAMGPALYFGVPIVAHRMAKFDPERAFHLMSSEAVRLAFLPPTALKLMAQVRNPDRFGCRLRAIVAAGEAMGAALLDWGQEAFGLQINEFYGQTECNMVIGNNARLAPPRPGWMGQVMPGHDLAVLGPDGTILSPGAVGELAIRCPDPGMFLNYWKKPEKTAERYFNAPDGQRWMLTGDQAERDETGYFRFSARADDVITSSGYRVGPSEIEDCLTAHPAVAVAAVVGVPDPLRTEVIAAFVMVADGVSADDDLAADLITHTRTRLSPHLAPAQVHFVRDIPMTSTGKIMRRELRATLIEEQK